MAPASLADLTRTVGAMAEQFQVLKERADSQQERAEEQHEVRKYSRSASTSRRENSPASVNVCKPRRLHPENPSERREAGWLRSSERASVAEGVLSGETTLREPREAPKIASRPSRWLTNPRSRFGAARDG
jgi:hypothetical protein